MRLQLITVSQTPPKWVTTACDEYIKRLPRHFNFEHVRVPLVKRHASSSANAMAKEAEQILKAMPEKAHCILLDVSGKHVSSEQLAEHLASWQMEGMNISIVIGGPEGHHDSMLERAQARWSLSHMTFPHTLAKVMLCEQLYRAHTLTQGHPYHNG